MQKRHIDRLQYFRELAQTSERYFMPYIKDFLDMAGPISILEVGCGDGGNLLHFVEKPEQTGTVRRSRLGHF